MKITSIVIMITALEADESDRYKAGAGKQKGEK